MSVAVKTYTAAEVAEAEKIKAKAEDSIGMCTSCKEWTSGWGSCCGAGLEYYDGPGEEDVDWAYEVLEG